MPSLETSQLDQKAVLWELSGTGIPYDDYGEPIVEAGEEIDCRWQWGKKEGISSRGTPIAWEAQVAVDREIAVGSTMWKGELDDYVATETKLQVLDYVESPSLDGKETRRVVRLGKLSDELPTLES